MDEVAFLKELAKEVLASRDERTTKVYAWCHDIEKRINSSYRLADQQVAQAAVATAEILVRANGLEETQESVTPHIHRTVFNNSDDVYPRYYYQADFKNRTIKLDVQIVGIHDMRKTGNWKFEPLIIPMRIQVS